MKVNRIEKPAVTNFRNSNIEALRMVAMFMILMLHVNNFSIGEPSTEESIVCPIPTFARCFFESVSLISVNLFVMISGWFSIRFSFRRLFAFIFQSVYIISFLYILGLVLGYASVNEEQLEECLFMSRYGWFIKAYIGLLILSPVLNYYAECASEKEFRLLLVCLFSFQTLYACFVNGAEFIQVGYSTFSFIVIYLLARYVRIHRPKLIDKVSTICLIAFVCYIAWGYLPVRFGVMRLYYMSLHFTNPVNIAFAMGFMLLSVKSRPRYNRFINYIAASTFAVYLCHMCNTWTANLYKDISIDIIITTRGAHTWL